MWETIRNNPRAFAAAVVLHLVLLGMFALSFESSVTLRPSSPKVNIVQATVVDAARVEEEVRKLKEAEASKQQQQDEEKKRLQELKRKRAAEEQQLKELERKRVADKAAEKKRQAAAKKKQALEKQRLAKLKKEQAALKQKKKAEAEAKRLAALEAERKAEKQRKEAARKQAEAEKQRKAEQQRKAEAARRQQEREAALQAQMAAEQNQTLIAKYIAIIQQNVQRRWLRPPGSAKGLTCDVEVRLAPGGDVMAVRVVKSSGNAAFDRSVEAAVRKASPLDVPSEPALFDQFRQITFEFNPQD